MKHVLVPFASGVRSAWRSDAHRSIPLWVDASCKHMYSHTVMGHARCFSKTQYCRNYAMPSFSYYCDFFSPSLLLWKNTTKNRPLPYAGWPALYIHLCCACAQRTSRYLRAWLASHSKLWNARHNLLHCWTLWSSPNTYPVDNYCE